MNVKFEDIDYWKAIVLYGLNQATYKIALGRTIIELAEKGKNDVEWTVLSKTYLDNYIKRLRNNAFPQQSNPARKTVMERIIDSLSLDQISYNDAISRVETEAFLDVIPRFQTIGMNKGFAGERFYHFEHGKKLHLHDSVFKIQESHNNELLDELEARWSLLEGAFSMSHGDWELSNDIRKIYLYNGYRRNDITGNIPFLQGYQGNVCFYCGEEIMSGDIHVDHVIPRQFLQHDEIWNLVLSHSLCNTHKSDALVGRHYIEKLIYRNENIMGSNHPWKRKIATALGLIPTERLSSTFRHYENAKIALRNNFWENSPNYNRETDPFFKKLITILNNK